MAHPTGYTGYLGERREHSSPPVEYRGYLVYERAEQPGEWGNVFDVVLNGKCVHQLAGINGARRHIDSVLDGGA